MGEKHLKAQLEAHPISRTKGHRGRSSREDTYLSSAVRVSEAWGRGKPLLVSAGVCLPLWVPWCPLPHIKQ